MFRILNIVLIEICKFVLLIEWQKRFGVEWRIKSVPFREFVFLLQLRNYSLKIRKQLPLKLIYARLRKIPFIFLWKHLDAKPNYHVFNFCIIHHTKYEIVHTNKQTESIFIISNRVYLIISSHAKWNLIKLKKKFFL